MDTNIWSHPYGNSTLFQERCEVVHIACSRTVLSVSAHLLDKSSRFKLLERRVNRFLIHAAFICDEPSWRKTVVGVLIAVPKQTTIDYKLLWLQTKLEYLIGNNKEIFVFHFTSWWQNKKTRIYTQAFTETPISERHSFAKKMDAPCRYVSTSLLTQINLRGHKATSYVYSEELIWHLIHLFDFETHIFVRGFILT